MFDNVLSLTKQAKTDLCKGDIVVRPSVQVESSEPEAPKLNDKQLEDVLRAKIRQYAQCRIRPWSTNANGGWKRIAEATDEVAQDIYDDLVISQTYDSVSSKVIAKAIASVENFSVKYVKKVIEDYRNILTPRS